MLEKTINYHGQDLMENPRYQSNVEDGAIEAIVLSTQHSPEITNEEITSQLIEHVIKLVVIFGMTISKFIL